MHKTYLIIFNASRGNRDKFFDVLAGGKLVVHEMINQIDNSGMKEITIFF